MFLSPCLCRAAFMPSFSPPTPKRALLPFPFQILPTLATMSPGSPSQWHWPILVLWPQQVFSLDSIHRTVPLFCFSCSILLHSDLTPTRASGLPFLPQSGGIREGFSEEVAVDGSFWIRKGLLGLGKKTGLAKWKQQHVPRQGRRKRATALGAG